MLWLLGPALQGLLAVVASIAAYQIIVSTDARLPHIETSKALAGVANDISVALISSWFFNLLVIVIPGIRKRIWLRNWLEGRYLDFKRSLITIYFSTLGESWEDEDIEALLDANRFAEFCLTRHTSDQTKWDGVHNGLYEWGLPEIRGRCELFLSECELAIGLVGELGDGSAKLMNGVRYLALRANVSEPNYDDIKNLMRTLFGLHCPWSVLDGERFEDRLRQLAKQI